MNGAPLAIEEEDIPARESSAFAEQVRHGR
jgi:hypothetical protein